MRSVPMVTLLGTASILGILAACNEYNLERQNRRLGIPEDCNIDLIEPEDIAPIADCAQPPGNFNPIVEYTVGEGLSCRGVPAVGDLDGDGLPEIVLNQTGGFLPGGKGDLYVYNGDGSLKFQKTGGFGYATGLTLADIGGDRDPEILGVKAYGDQLPLSANRYSVVAFDNAGNQIWESQQYDDEDFDYATGIIVSDMEHDGDVEIVAGRVILKSDGSLRGKGTYGRGCYGYMPNIFDPNEPVSEATVPAVADLDLDGVEEVITGNAMYNPDGSIKWLDPGKPDGMIAVANLDDDEEGEFVAITGNTVRFVDTDGQTTFGPWTLEGGNILSPPAIADLDEDGYPEVVVAGGNTLVTLNHDGSVLWSGSVIDESGATGASIFDFEGDGELDVVYIDEDAMYAFEGSTGGVKFFNREHNSDTMMDYPVVADVDSDGQAEILVCHANMGHGMSVFGDANESWGPARRTWNQHAYTINNVNDDLSIPQDAEPAFTTHNTYHAGIDPRYLAGNLQELSVEILDDCQVDCAQGDFYVVARVINRSEVEIEAGLPVSLYAVTGEAATFLTTVELEDALPPGRTGEPFSFTVAAGEVTGATAIRVTVDDLGTGLGIVSECDERDNSAEIAGPFCEAAAE